MNCLTTPTTRRFHRAVQRVFAFLVLSVLALAVQAQAPSYLIEQVEVRGLRHASPEIVIDESRLLGGNEYAETELRAGVDRIRRLPFILDAELSLEKGSERDAFILVIEVEEARPVFYAAQLIPAAESGRELIRDPSDDHLAVGARLFLGAHSMVHIGALTRDDDRPESDTYQIAQIGFTRFGLLDGRAFVTLTLNRSFPGGGSMTPGLVAGMYLGNDRTLTLSVEDIDIEYIRVRRERVAQLRYARNTTDDPFFPERGSVLAISPLWVESETYRHFDEGSSIHTNSLGAESELARYWELGERWTLGAEAEGGYLNTHVEIGGDPGERKNLFYGSVRTRLSWDIHSGSTSNSRVEISLSSVSDHDDAYQLQSGYHQISIGWARRDAWGTVRLGAGFAW